MGECPRRTEEGEKQVPYLPRKGRMTGGSRTLMKLFQVVKLSFLALVTSKELPQDGKEENDGVDPGDFEKPQKAERSEAHSQPL